MSFAVLHPQKEFAYPPPPPRPVKIAEGIYYVFHGFNISQLLI